MIIALGFLLPLVIYLALYFRFPAERLGKISPFAALLCAVFSSLAILFVLSFMPHWKEGTQIAWTGIETTSSTLSIGGSPEEALVGWPNESFAPYIKASTTSDRSVTIEVSGGDAFVLDVIKNSFVNGETVSPGTTKTFGEYSVRVSRSIIPFRRQSVEIMTAQDETLIRFKLPKSARRERVYSLRSIIDRNAGDLRNDAAKLMRLEAWAEDLRLLLARNGDIRILNKDKAQAQCELPCRVSVMWTNQSFPLTIQKNQFKLALNFESPWRLTSPLPPPTSDDKYQMVVTGRALPSDTAFLLPLGRAAENVRGTLLLSSTTPHVFTSSNASPAGDTTAGVTSRAEVAAGPTSFLFATVNNLPSRWKIFLLLLVALIVLAAGLILSFGMMPEGISRWTLYGFIAALWSLLSLRVLLSFRYALDPAYLSESAIRGVSLSLTGIAVVPGLVLLFARLRRDMLARPESLRDRKKAALYALGYLLLLGAAFIIEYYFSTRLWAAFPQSYAPSLGFVYTAIITVIFFYLAGTILFLYGTEPSEERRQVIRSLFLLPVSFVEDFALAGKRWWGSLAAGSVSWAKFMAYSLIAAVLFFCIPFVFRYVPGSKFFQDLLIPALFVWLPALFWLSSKLYFKPGSDRAVSWRALFVYALLMIVLPVFIVPAAIRDAGGIIVTLAIFVTLGLFLLATSPHLRGGVALIPILVALLAVVIIYSSYLTSFPLIPGEARVRLLSFREGGAIQRLLPEADASGSSSDGLTLQKLRNGYQHAWENRAIAHEGGWMGLKFGNSPSRNSQIPQGTLQFDSAYSFFIVSEHGLIGGASLLLIYAVPLALVLLAGRSRFDIGYGVAMVIAGVLLLEALLHAAMNTGLLPFTGRNLPLISANSPTDLLRWMVLFIVGAQALLWRYTGQGDYAEEAISIITPETEGGAQPLSGDGKRVWPRGGLESNLSAQRSGEGERKWRYGVAVAGITLIPALVFLLVLRSGWGIIQDKSLDDPFGWDGLLAVVQTYIIDGKITLQPDQTLTLDESLKSSGGGTYLEREVRRFNALPLGERMDDRRSESFSNKLVNVKTLADYNRLMDETRRQSSIHRESRRSSLFKLLPPKRWVDENYVKKESNYTVTVNSEINTRLSFKTPQQAADVPHISFRGDKNLLIGPAWIRGKWISAFDADPILPWTKQLTDALSTEWKRMGEAEAAKQYNSLTLDRNLQKAVATFVSEKGREVQIKLLSASQKNQNLPVSLPPRVAFSIINLPNGEVLAMGGWPHMTSDRFWRRGGDNQEWLPPSDWLDRYAPRDVQSLYGGDRNFDLMVVGSASKPLWASAVLAVHPELDQQLMTRGGEEEESDVFGIKLSSGWHVTKTGWVDFRTYLSQSDNRYHVRLGFLGLAEKENAVVEGVGTSRSVRESLTGKNPQSWNKYPAFSGINFSFERPETMAQLDRTPLARHLRAMYSIGVARGDFEYRRSFWSGNEYDDARAATSDLSTDKNVKGRLSESFRTISPPATNLALDSIAAPRDYVSLLLGGGTNLWSNVGLAAAFGTCITGQPVNAHITTHQNAPTFLEGRERFPAIAARLRPGLAAVVKEGTARKLLQETNALTYLNGLRDVKIYAKTGTLKAKAGTQETSRLVIALIRWDNERQGSVRKGLVFSIVGEEAELGTSTRWFGEFLIKHRTIIERLLA
jgi:cell division protein FtsW (lipid II flippase)/cell division protein FtsI/penicillin-binding protein 2